MERVEDEMRIELGAQQLQLGPRVQRLCALRANLGVAGALAVVPRVSGPDHRELDHPIEQGLPQDDRGRG